MSTLSTANLCSDCGVTPGIEHGPGCDVARCLHSGAQRLGHELDPVTRLAGATVITPDHDCGRDVWTGEWSGTADARRLGWWVYWGPHHGETNEFIPCAEDHPGALPDLTRIVTTCRWDRGAHRWEHP